MARQLASLPATMAETMAKLPNASAFDGLYATSEHEILRLLSVLRPPRVGSIAKAPRAGVPPGASLPRSGVSPCSPTRAEVVDPRAACGRSFAVLRDFAVPAFRASALPFVRGQPAPDRASEAVSCRRGGLAVAKSAANERQVESLRYHPGRQRVPKIVDSDVGNASPVTDALPSLGGFDDMEVLLLDGKTQSD
jgi:hypothetical protein